jgi:OOP family OmpA-OmpF porin
VVDREDGCPDEVGTASNKGCPEIPQALVAFTQEERSILYFAFDSANIDDTNNALIQQVVALLKQYRASQIRIIGHASSEGSASYNQKLSEQRANAVRQAIVAAGIDADRVEAVGAGEDQPIANNASKSGRAKNRRVVFEVQ